MQAKEITLDKKEYSCAPGLLFVGLLLVPTLAFSIDSPMGLVLCNAADMFQGNAGRGLATIGIAVVGVGASLGRITWGMACMVGAGIACLFGAAGIVAALGGGGC